MDAGGGSAASAGGHLESLGFKGLPRVSHAMMQISDWNPKLCELAGCTLQPKQPLDGDSAWHLLTNPTNVSKRTDIYQLS